MRIAIISDIHGNQLALEAVLRDLAGQHSTQRLARRSRTGLAALVVESLLETVAQMAGSELLTLALSPKEQGRPQVAGVEWE